MVLYSNNAKSYYNRIVHSITSISIQHKGMLIQPLKSIFLTIQSMEHIVRTAFEDSSSSIYSRNKELPY